MPRLDPLAGSGTAGEASGRQPFGGRRPGHPYRRAISVDLTDHVRGSFACIAGSRRSPPPSSAGCPSRP
jgi:hypothetical protein